MDICCVPRCFNSLNSKFKLFHFPDRALNKQIRSIWIQNLGIEENEDVDKFFVCEVHFTEFQFRNSPDNKFLHWNAIPTKFLPPPSKNNLIVRSPQFQMDDNNQFGLGEPPAKIIALAENILTNVSGSKNYLALENGKKIIGIFVTRTFFEDLFSENDCLPIPLNKITISQELVFTKGLREMKPPQVPINNKKLLQKPFKIASQPNNNCPEKITDLTKKPEANKNKSTTRLKKNSFILDIENEEQDNFLTNEALKLKLKLAYGTINCLQTSLTNLQRKVEFAFFKIFEDEEEKL